MKNSPLKQSKNFGPGSTTKTQPTFQGHNNPFLGHGTTGVSLFTPTLFGADLEKKDVSEPGHFDQTMNTPTDQVIKNITSKKTDTKGKKKDIKNGTEAGGKKIGSINPELLLAMTMPFAYVIGKGLSSLFGRRRDKKEEIAREGVKQTETNKHLSDKLSKLRKKQLKLDEESDKQLIADTSSKHTLEVEPFVDKAPGIAKPKKKQTFKQAFATARKAGKKTFTWNKNKYTTKLKEES